MGEDGQSWSSQQYVLLMIVDVDLTKSTTGFPAGNLDFTARVEHPQRVALVLLYCHATGYCIGTTEPDVSVYIAGR